MSAYEFLYMFCLVSIGLGIGGWLHLDYLKDEAERRKPNIIPETADEAERGADEGDSRHFRNQ